LDTGTDDASRGQGGYRVAPQLHPSRGPIRADSSGLERTSEPRPKRTETLYGSGFPVNHARADDGARTHDPQLGKLGSLLPTTSRAPELAERTSEDSHDFPPGSMHQRGKPRLGDRGRRGRAERGRASCVPSPRRRVRRGSTRAVARSRLRSSRGRRTMAGARPGVTPCNATQIVRMHRVQVRTWRPITTTGLPGLWPMRKQRRRRIAALTVSGRGLPVTRGKPA